MFRRMNGIAFLQHWYASHCNGDWEHAFGVSISTIDNPGWRVEINLENTELSGVPLPEYRVEYSETDWVMCWIRHGRFQGAGDPSKLEAILGQFQAFASLSTSPGEVT